MSLDLALLRPMVELRGHLAEQGIEGEIVEGRWLRIDVAQAMISVESRPFYCDRGRLIVKVFPSGEFANSLDSQDGFPRYYFGTAACASEIAAWMRARMLL